MLTPFQRQKIKEYFAKQPVEVVYLFGSQATGKANKLSDVDFAVLFKPSLSSSKRFDLRLEFMSELGRILKRDDAEVVDLEEAPVALRYSAIAPRHQIYIADDDKRAVFEAETTSRYFDELYFIKQNTYYSLSSIAKMA